MIDHSTWKLLVDTEVNGPLKSGFTVCRFSSVRAMAMQRPHERNSISMQHGKSSFFFSHSDWEIQCRRGADGGHVLPTFEQTMVGQTLPLVCLISVEFDTCKLKNLRFPYRSSPGCRFFQRESMRTRKKKPLFRTQELLVKLSAHSFALCQNVCLMPPGTGTAI